MLSRVGLFLTPWNSLGQNTGVGNLSILQGIFPTHRSNPGLPHYKQILYQLSYQGSPCVWITANCGKFLKSWKYQTTLTCLLRNLYAGQEVTVRTRHGTTDWFQIRKGVHQSCIMSPCLFNLYSEYIMRNSRLDEAQAGIKIAR